MTEFSSTTDTNLLQVVDTDAVNDADVNTCVLDIKSNCFSERLHGSDIFRIHYAYSQKIVTLAIERLQHEGRVALAKQIAAELADLRNFTTP